MAVPRNSKCTVYSVLQTNGQGTATINGTAVTEILVDGNGDLLLVTGTTVPTDTSSGYAKGCLFIDTDVATGTTGLNCNKGTNTSCQFTAVTQA